MPYQWFNQYIQCSAASNSYRATKLPSMNKKHGFTFIEVLVGTSLILIVFLGIFGAYQLGMKVIGQSKNKIVATALVNEQIEKIRNLPYESVGVKGSFPDGVLDSATTTILNGIEYKIERRVDFVVDPADGIAPPNDDCPNDYKKVEIKVSWPGRFPGEVKIFSDFSPKNLAQECTTGGGILSVSVFDAYGQMVSLPLIEVKNPETDQVLKSATPIEGKHYFSLATSTYKVVVSKSGYSSERTYGTDEIAIPEKPHPIVLEGQITEISFPIDQLSSMTVETRGTKGAGYPIIHNVTFKLCGTKIIGLDNNENPVFKYSQTHTTNGPGKIAIPGLEWDSYNFFVDPASGLDLVEIESAPGTTTTQPIALSPASSKEVRLILKAENSLLVTVENIETLEPIFSALTTLSNESLGYEKTQYTDEKGQTYFIPLESATYNLEAQAPGCLATSTTISVSGDTTKTIKLEQIE